MDFKEYKPKKALHFNSKYLNMLYDIRNEFISKNDCEPRIIFLPNAHRTMYEFETHKMIDNTRIFGMKVEFTGGIGKPICFEE
jgi:hypothetical protein